MLDIFLLPYHTNNRLTNPSLDRYLEVYNYSISKIMDYYKSENFYVKRPNILVSILENMEIGPHLSKEDIVSYLDSNINYISRNFDIVSDGNTGDILHNVITHNSNEIFMLTDIYNPFDIDESNYEDIESIRCIYNTDNMFNISHPYRIKHLTGSDIVIYELDLMALGLQYHYWSKEQIELDRDIDPARFLYSIPLTNLIKSYTDITLFNGFIDLWNGDDIPDTVRYNPIVVVDPTTNVKKGYIDLIKNLKKNKYMLYVDLLNSIPLLTDTALQSLRLNKLYYTLQDRWVMWLSRIEYIYWLLDSYGIEGIKRNEKYVKELLIDIKNSERDGTFRRIPKNMVIDMFFNMLLSNVKIKINYRL